MAPIPSTSATISTARGGRWKSALESVMPHFLFCLSDTLTLPKSVDKTYRR
jgi:hypothetical protein